MVGCEGRGARDTVEEVADYSSLKVKTRIFTAGRHGGEDAIRFYIGSLLSANLTRRQHRGNLNGGA